MGSVLTRERDVALPASESTEWDWENMADGESAVVPAKFEAEVERFIATKPGWRYVVERVKGDDEDGSNMRVWFLDESGG